MFLCLAWLGSGQKAKRWNRQGGILCDVHKWHLQMDIDGQAKVIITINRSGSAYKYSDQDLLHAALNNIT